MSIPTVLSKFIDTAILSMLVIGRSHTDGTYKNVGASYYEIGEQTSTVSTEAPSGCGASLAAPYLASSLCVALAALKKKRKE